MIESRWCCVQQWVNSLKNSELNVLVGDGVCSEEVGIGAVTWKVYSCPWRLLPSLCFLDVIG